MRAHHLWAFLVDHFLSAEALPHDLVVRVAHDLRGDHRTQPQAAAFLFHTLISTNGSLWLRVAHLDEVSVEQIVVFVKKTCGRKTKTNAILCVVPATFVSKL